ncbi:MAG: hypothetical protein ACREHD_04240, partial [Pirellulales bacterium]
VDEGGRIVGFRVRLWETDGRAGRVHLRSFRPPVAARHIGFSGQTLATLNIEGDVIALDFSAYELVEVEGRW